MGNLDYIVDSSGELVLQGLASIPNLGAVGQIFRSIRHPLELRCGRLTNVLERTEEYEDPYEEMDESANSRPPAPAQ